MPGSTRNRRSRPLVRGALGFVLGGALHAGDLPCFLADNHAETFGWIARTADLDTPHTLVLVDAHSDASAAERSEEIREQLRRVVSEEERSARIAAWRSGGRIQAFNWIEPLMPRPLERVRWWAAPGLSANRRETLRHEAVDSLDGRLEIEPRDAGSFASRWTTHDLADAPAVSGPALLAIDLDFFAGMPEARRDECFAAIWRHAMEWPELRGVAFAVSRPWLRDDAEADALVRMAVAAVARTRGATLELHAAADTSPDGSLQAARWRETGREIPRWSPQAASPALRATLGLLGGRLRVTGAAVEFPPPLRIVPDDGQVDCDGVWRFPRTAAPALRTETHGGATGRVRWFALDPLHAAVDLWPHTGLGKGFSIRPARRVSETPRPLATTGDFALAPEAWVSPHGGRLRIAAEVETADGWLPTAPVEIRLAGAGGFRGALSECLGMPYVFGIAGVAEDGLSGVETGWGADCSNLLIHAWRRQGVPLSWGDPGRLRTQLRRIAENRRADDATAIDARDVERGLAIDFGQHVAAVWEDLPPVGRLGGNDRVFHHLGGFPELTELGKLAAGRPPFALLTPHEAAGPVIRIAGDVVLAGEDAHAIDGFGKGTAAWFLANLEGIPSMRPPAAAPRYDFRFPPDRLAMLRDAGIDAVSLANNHAGDAGPDGLLEGIRALRDHRIGITGAGANARDACDPWRAESGGQRIAVFGISLVGGMPARADAPGIACLPDHAGLLGQSLAEARRRGERIIVLLHGGDEYRTAVNDDQRRWSRWLVARGARLIAGAGPHVIQRTEIHGGSVIAHSLGNAVYPAALRGADSGEIRSFEIP